jgi:protease-4
MRSPLEELFNRDRESIAISALREYLGGNFDLMMMLRDVKNEDFIQARMPFDLNIK